MQQRLDLRTEAPDGMGAIFGVETYLRKSPRLSAQDIHLVKLRASQMNGCSYCVDMHTKEARKDGLGEQWIALICAWRESPVFSDKERALLEWTEAVTQLGQKGPSDTLYEALANHYTPGEIADLSIAIAQINVWNRLAVSFRMQHPIDPVN